MQFAKRIIRCLAEQNYYTAKLLWKRDQRQVLQGYRGNPIITYQMGKVGSSTIHASLVALDKSRPIYHVHFLNPGRVGELEAQRRQYFGTEKISLLRRPWLSEFLFEQIQESSRHWKIVTLVREPIARNVSTFFENLEVIKQPDSDRYEISSDYYGFEISIDIDNIDPLIELFFDRLVHERPLTYFDDEIKYVFGIDVFESQFPEGKGYMLYQGDKADMLLVRLEDLNRCATTAFKEFLDIDDFTLIQTNVAEEKVYAPLYREFKKRIRFPDSYLDRMYQSKFTRQFYSDDEIRNFRQRWSNKDSE